MQDCVIELANKLLARVVPLAPSNQGELRRGWTIGEVTLTSAGAVIEVFNHIEYSFYIENGFATHWVPGKWEDNKLDKKVQRSVQRGGAVTPIIPVPDMDSENGLAKKEGERDAT
jgi:hypothetical protein